MRSRLAIGLAAALVLAACSTSKDEGTTPTSGVPDTTAASSTSTGSTDTTPGSTDSSVPTESTYAPVVDDRAPGVTADAIKVGITFPDLASINTGTNHGDYAKAYQAAIDRVNAAGGVNGRKLEAVISPVALTGTDASAAACTKLTQDEQVFVVTGFLQGDDVLCYIDDNSTIALGGQITAERMTKSKALWYTTEPSQDGATAGLAKLAAASKLSGKLAIISSAGTESIVDAVKAVLDGVNIVDVAFTAQQVGSTDVNASLAEMGTIAEKFKSEGVDQVLMLADTGVNFPKAVAGTDWRPQFVFPDLNGSTVYAKTDGADLSVMENALAAGYFDVNNHFAELGEPSKSCFADLQQSLGITLVPGGEVKPGEPKWIVSVVTACRNVELLKLILEKAGPDLNYGTFTTAAYNLGPVLLPGYPDEWNFSKDHPDGQAPISLYQWDQATTAMQQLES